jgi:hypothetical protein
VLGLRRNNQLDKFSTHFLSGIGCFFWVFFVLTEVYCAKCSHNDTHCSGAARSAVFVQAPSFFFFFFFFFLKCCSPFRLSSGAHVLIAVAVCVGLAHAITLSANDNCYFPDAAPFLSTSVEGLTDLPRGWTKYWFLSVDRLAAVAVGLPGNYMTCSSESFTQNSIPAFTVGIPLGRDKCSCYYLSEPASALCLTFR